MKIEKIKLYDLEIVEIDGEFREVKKNEKTIPLLLTNYSLLKGRELGILKTSTMEELANLVTAMGSVDGTLDEEKYGQEVFIKMAEVIDDRKLLGILFLGALGANPNLEYTFEEFAKKYHGTLEEGMTLYANLLQNLAMTENSYKKEFEKLTSKKKVQGEKK